MSQEPNTNTSAWNALDAHREMKVLRDGKILVIRPSDQTTVVPLFCPLCKFPMRTSDDSLSYRKALCCDKCFMECRGKPEELRPGQWEEYLKNRQNNSKPIFTWK